jgi:NAD-dependent SIR2 family protein deacetylase
MTQPKVSQSAKSLLDSADCIIVGAGAGLSASGGINYVSPEFFTLHYPAFAKRRYRTIWETMGSFWDLIDSNETQYWAFFSHHLLTIRYEYPVVQPYLDLYQYLQNRDYLIVTTNVDHQFHKAGFPPDKIWAMQGDYAFLQCETPCTREVYENETLLRKMKATFNPDTLTIDRSTIPRCPRCGKHLVPNLRKDDTFVDDPHLANRSLYHRFLKDAVRKNFIFLELGVGFNSPGALKYPFEQLVAGNPTFRLVRVNLNDLEFILPIHNKSTVVKQDLAEFLRNLIVE